MNRVLTSAWTQHCPPLSSTVSSIHPSCWSLSLLNTFPSVDFSFSFPSLLSCLVVPLCSWRGNSEALKQEGAVTPPWSPERFTCSTELPTHRWGSWMKQWRFFDLEGRGWTRYLPITGRPLNLLFATVHPICQRFSVGTVTPARKEGRSSYQTSRSSSPSLVDAVTAVWLFCDLDRWKVIIQQV